MSDVVIRVENLSKSYQYGAISHGTLTRDLQSWWARMRGKEDPNATLTHSQRSGKPGQRFWALQDVSFDVKQGEIVGIIGRNGAGKSTLLKILSEITTPTSGCVKLKGRVGSLLEVGTGFHPELTGQENIYLNGAILGMTKAEIRKKFDEIVAFAEIEEFIDTPVKRYSSGMYVRLAFAVAAHLEPEILLVDEVLAVGDFAFQKKCLGKMQSVAGQGRTVLFISHHMQAITNLCPRSMLLQDGVMINNGASEDIVAQYLQSARQLTTIPVKDRKDRVGEGRIKFLDTWIENKNNKRITIVQSGEPLTIVSEYQIIDKGIASDVFFSFALNGENGIQITNFSNIFTGDLFLEPVPNHGQVRCVIPRLPLNSGKYHYNAWVSSSGLTSIQDYVIDAGYFEVEKGDFFGTGKSIDIHRMILVDHKWNIRSMSNE